MKWSCILRDTSKWLRTNTNQKDRAKLIEKLACILTIVQKPTYSGRKWENFFIYWKEDDERNPILCYNMAKYNLVIKDGQITFVEKE